MNKRNLSFSWDIIYKCNYRCSYCWWDGKWAFLDSENKYLSVEELMRSWLRIYNMYGEVHVEILGGEPFIYPHFVGLIEELSVYHTINISTNLSWNIDRVIKECDSSRVKIRPTFHPAFSKLDAFLKKAQALRETGFTQGVTYLAYPPQIKQLNFYKKIFQKKNFEFSVLTFWGEYNSHNYPDAYSEEERKIISPSLAQRNGENFQLSRIQSPRGKSCYAGCLYACIHPNGKTFRCGGGADKAIGNFFDGNFKLLDGPAPCTSDICPCNEWVFLMEENINKKTDTDVEVSTKMNETEERNMILSREALERREIKIVELHHSTFKQKGLQETSPIEFSWEICYTCNYRCPYCGRWNDASNDDLKLDVEEWKRIWERIYEKYGSCNMYISGAEPTTYPKFFDITQRISDMHTITICTNFSWDVTEILDRNINSERMQFTPTFHSLFADFDVFLEKAVRLKDWIRNKMVFFVAYQLQMDKVNYYKHRVNESGLNFSVVPLRDSDGDGKVKVISTQEEKDKIRTITDMHEDEFAYLSQDKSPKGKLCRAGYRYAMIKATGKVFPCSQSNRFLGHIHKDDFTLLEEPTICLAEFCPYESYNLIERCI